MFVSMNSFFQLNLDQHFFHTIRGLFPPLLLVSRIVAIHLVHVVVGLLHPHKSARSRCACGHILDEIPVIKCIGGGVVPLVSEKLFRVAVDAPFSLPLLLPPNHEEGTHEGWFLKAFRILFRLVKLSLRNTTQLEEEASSGGRAPSRGWQACRSK